MVTNNEDCRRVFVKFSRQIGKYFISWSYVILQFHRISDVLQTRIPGGRMSERATSPSIMMDIWKSLFD